MVHNLLLVDILCDPQLNLFNRVHNRRVVSPPKRPTDLR